MGLLNLNFIMKNLLFLTLFITGLSNAQLIDFGVKLGYVNSVLNFKEKGIEGSFDFKSNIYVSMPVEFHVHPRLSLQGELALAGLGGENLTINNQISRLHLTTVYIPVGVKLYPIKNRLSLIGGLNLGFTLKALGKIDGQKVEFNNLNSSNHSYFFGGEVKITKSIFAEARYNKGISNIVKEPGKIMKHNFLQVGVGYIFDK